MAEIDQKVIQKRIRSYNAGQKMANAIIEMVHLMYQNKTALNFYSGLLTMLEAEFTRRKDIAGWLKDEEGNKQ